MYECLLGSDRSDAAASLRDHRNQGICKDLPVPTACIRTSAAVSASLMSVAMWSVAVLAFPAGGKQGSPVATKLSVYADVSAAGVIPTSVHGSTKAG